MSAHAKFSPSGASIWLNCPASVRLSEGFPDSTNEASERGTRIHQTAEEMLRGHPVTHLEHVDDAKGYVEYVREATAGFDEVFIEHKLRGFWGLVEGVWGTADIFALKDTHGLIADLKTGRVPVDAAKSPQLEVYAAAAHLEFGLETCEVVIWQNGTVTSRLLTVEDFERTVNQVKDAVLRSPIERAKPGAHCTWCRARAHCRERAVSAMTVIGSEFTTDSDLPEMLAAARRAVDWANDIEDRALDAMKAGVSVHGFKLVDANTKRRWTEDALNVIEYMGLTELLTVRTPLTITKVERMLGKREASALMAVATEKPPGNPVVVTQTDPRPSIATHGQLNKDDWS